MRSSRNTEQGDTLQSSKIIKNSLLLVSYFLVIGLIFSSHTLFDTLNEQWIDTYIRNNGVPGVINFLLITALAATVGAPRQLIAFLGGYTFGFVFGTLISVLAATLACILSFSVARFLLRPWVKQRFSHRIEKFDRFLQHDTFSKTVVIRLLPVGSNLITNLVAGVTHIKASHFVFGSAIGYIPQMLIFALMGKGIVVLDGWKIAMSIGLFVVSLLISLKLYRSYKAAATLNEDDVNQSSDTVRAI